MFKKVGDNKSINCNDEEYVKLKSKWFNEEIGDLNLIDGIDCDLCKNKGTISFVENNQEIQKECSCMIKRKIYSRLKKCGVSQEMLEHYTFKNFKAENDWQQSSLNIVVDYIKSCKDNKYWLYISGIHGSGKTHLCIAACQKFIKTGNYTFEYMKWNEIASKLISLSRSYEQKDYDYMLRKYQECDLLYIDDFLKLTNKMYQEEVLSMAFKILDYRYTNKKYTIISSEVSPNELYERDGAIFGRINEMTNKGKFMIYTGEDESRDFRIN